MQVKTADSTEIHRGAFGEEMTGVAAGDKSGEKGKASGPKPGLFLQLAANARLHRDAKPLMGGHCSRELSRFQVLSRWNP
jgi:hypothetical protein